MVTFYKLFTYAYFFKSHIQGSNVFILIKIANNLHIE